MIVNVARGKPAPVELAALLAVLMAGPAAVSAAQPQATASPVRIRWTQARHDPRSWQVVTSQ